MLIAPRKDAPLAAHISVTCWRPRWASGATHWGSEQTARMAPPHGHPHLLSLGPLATLDASPTDISFLSPLMGNKAKKEAWNILEAGGTEGRAGTRFLPSCAVPRLCASAQSSVPILPGISGPFPTVEQSPPGLPSLRTRSTIQLGSASLAPSQGPGCSGNSCWKNKSVK